MPHQCTKCGKVYPDASEELLQGCSCGSRFFYYIRQEKFDEIQSDVKKVMQELDKADKEQIEQDIRELTGLDKKPDEPVILDLESVRVIKPGKFEIDIVNLFAKNRPLIYKLGEGKYIIDIASSLEVDKENFEPKFSKENFDAISFGNVNESKFPKDKVGEKIQDPGLDSVWEEESEEEEKEDDNKEVSEGENEKKEDVEESESGEDNQIRELE